MLERARNLGLAMGCFALASIWSAPAVADPKAEAVAPTPTATATAAATATATPTPAPQPAPQPATATAKAKGPATDIGSVIRAPAPPGDNWRHLLDALLFIPRGVIQLVALTSSTTASFIEDQQLIPRARALLGSEDGTVRITPTFSIASGLRPDLGARLTSNAGPFASMLRTSIVSRDVFVTESRLLLSLGKEAKSQIVIEGFQQRDGELAFGGIGPVPALDPRNAFLPGHEGLAGAFLEKRERVILGFGSRIAHNVELILSSSFQRRAIEDPRNADGGTLADTFAPNSVAGAYSISDRVYTEGVLRLDTRAVRGPPAPGVLLEGYGGASEDVHGNFASALHLGGRAALFVPVVRKTTIINPRFTLDVVEPTGNGRLPFREYAFANGFRGSDGRVDVVAALASLDYRWQLANYVAARLFVDLTTVAPKITSLRLDHLGWAVGAAIDLHSTTTQIGRIGLAYSAHAIQLLFVYGLADPGFGDRQHR